MDRWEFTDRALEEFGALAAEDPEAYDYMVANLEHFARDGADQKLEPGLNAPVGRRVAQRFGGALPWAGEIKEAQSPTCRKPGKIGRPRQYRLYFMDISSDPGEPAHMMLVSSYTEKRVHLKDVNAGQDRDIAEALHRGIAWCRTENREYRRA